MTTPFPPKFMEIFKGSSVYIVPAVRIHINCNKVRLSHDEWRRLRWYPATYILQCPIFLIGFLFAFLCLMYYNPIHYAIDGIFIVAETILWPSLVLISYKLFRSTNGTSELSNYLRRIAVFVDQQAGGDGDIANIGDIDLEQQSGAAAALVPAGSGLQDRVEANTSNQARSWIEILFIFTVVTTLIISYSTAPREYEEQGICGRAGRTYSIKSNCPCWGEYEPELVAAVCPRKRVDNGTLVGDCDVVGYNEVSGTYDIISPLAGLVIVEFDVHCEPALSGNFDIRLTFTYSSVPENGACAESTTGGTESSSFLDLHRISDGYVAVAIASLVLISVFSVYILVATRIVQNKEAELLTLIDNTNSIKDRSTLNATNVFTDKALTAKIYAISAIGLIIVALICIIIAAKIPI